MTCGVSKRKVGFLLLVELVTTGLALKAFLGSLGAQEGPQEAFWLSDHNPWLIRGKNQLSLLFELIGHGFGRVSVHSFLGALPSR